MSQPRSGHQATLLDHNATVLIVGGTNNGAIVTTAETFVPWTGQFAATNPPAAARTSAIVSSTSTEGVAVLAGGKASNGALVAPAELYGFATVKTDRDDYAPGHVRDDHRKRLAARRDRQMVLHETGPGAEPDLPLIATADATGRIFNDIFAPNEGDIGRRFYLTVVGVGATAQTTFTDAPNNSTFSDTNTGNAVADFGAIDQNQCFGVWVQARQGGNTTTITVGEAGTVTLSSSSAGGAFFRIIPAPAAP